MDSADLVFGEDSSRAATLISSLILTELEVELEKVFYKSCRNFNCLFNKRRMNSFGVKVRAILLKYAGLTI